MRRTLLLVAAAVAAAIAGIAAATADGGGAGTGVRSFGTATPRQASLARPAAVHHYEYVVPDGALYVYDIDHGQRLVQAVTLPGVTGTRGVAVDVATHTLYISYGGDAGASSTGALLAFDLVGNRVLWVRHYDRGVDSMAVDPRSGRIFMPDGELSSDGRWTVLDARNGNIVGTIDAGRGPHNTVVDPSGARVYLGGRNSPWLNVASTSTDRIVKRIGPLASGVRPFTINGRETLAYTTATGFLGFQVSSIVTGRVLYTVNFGPRFSWQPATFPSSAPSHGISLSPDGRQLWVIDGPNSYVHVYDVSRVPGRPPRKLADLKLRDPLSGNETPCPFDCVRDGWVQHSLDGCYVYVGDSGDVFSTRTRKIVAFLPALRNTRKMLEIDWRDGYPIATSTRSGLGYISGQGGPPRCHG